MSEKKRKSFSADFKAKVALEAIHGVKTLNEIAQEYSVHPVQVKLLEKGTPEAGIKTVRTETWTKTG